MKTAMTVRAIVGFTVLVVVSVVPLTVSNAASGHATSPIVNVWTEPANGYGFLDAAIDGAHHSIDLSMYELSDATIEHDLIARADAGVDVRVLLNADYFGTEHNAASYALLHASKVHVEWAPSNQIFHAKYLVVDSRSAYIGTGNLETIDYPSTRDFWVEDTGGADVAATSDTFDADFTRHEATDQAGGLVWSPGSTSTLVELIGSARHSLLVENEEMDSFTIEAALMSAARRGVSVEVVMTESSSWTVALNALAAAGVHVRVLRSSQVYIHAKAICADCSSETGTVFVGSENFSISSLTKNRELGVLTTTSKVVRAVEGALKSDYAIGSAVTATHVSAPPTPSGGGAVTVTRLEASVSPGAEDSLSVHTSKPNDTCDLEVTLPSGYHSESHGLGERRANAQGIDTWTWEIGPSTDPGTARAIVTCGAGSVERNFQIR